VASPLLTPNHPAFLSTSEFDSLPQYEDIEEDPTYQSFYTRSHESLASIASLSDYVDPACIDEAWGTMVKRGFDIGGDLYFFKQGVKRKREETTCTDDDENLDFEPGSGGEVDDGSNFVEEDEPVSESEPEDEYAGKIDHSMIAKAILSWDPAVMDRLMRRMGISVDDDYRTKMMDGYGGYGEEIF
jgi:hypothetical protein